MGDNVTQVWRDIEIAVPHLFSWHEVLAYLNRSPSECLHRVTNDEVWKCVDLAGQRVLLRVGVKNEDTLRVAYLSDCLGDHQVVQYVREWFDLDRDLAPFYALAESDSLLQPLTLAHRGLRIVGVPDLFEALCWAVIGQQVNLAFAYTLKRKLVETYGDSMTLNGTQYWLFPRAESLASASVSDLRALQLTERKSEYLIGIAQKMVDGGLSKQGLQALGSGSAAERELCRIRGVGPWSANYVLMRCLRWQDAFPIQDAGLHQAVQRRLGWDRKPTLAELEELSRGWEGWRAYAVFYLWQSLLS